ncbi:hypothetical protein ACH5RR_029838 [Cinchona calisaya]|uniref:Retrotransposon gag domain-containing protein n=1 Tax=Cinchona calisaya TaxID=153742 RepID=A0ABD2YX66_9GENT
MYFPSPMRNREGLYLGNNDGNFDEIGSYVKHDEEIWDRSPGHRRNAREDRRVEGNREDPTRELREPMVKFIDLDHIVQKTGEMTSQYVERFKIACMRCNAWILEEVAKQAVQLVAKQAVWRGTNSIESSTQSEVAHHPMQPLKAEVADKLGIHARLCDLNRKSEGYDQECRRRFLLRSYDKEESMLRECTVECCNGDMEKETFTDMGGISQQYLSLPNQEGINDGLEPMFISMAVALPRSFMQGKEQPYYAVEQEQINRSSVAEIVLNDNEETLETIEPLGSTKSKEGHMNGILVPGMMVDHGAAINILSTSMMKKFWKSIEDLVSKQFHQKGNVHPDILPIDITIRSQVISATFFEVES